MTNRQMMTCAKVDAALLEYLEETLDGGTRAAVDEHVAGCLRCSAILRDIGAIRVQAAQLPELAPSRDLWAGISARIEPTVLPLGRSRQEPRRSWIPLAAAAAAALVIGTAGITYVATSRSLRPSAEKVASAPKSPTVEQQLAPTPAPAEVVAPAAAPTAERSTPRAAPRGVTLASRRSETPASLTDIAYGDEIARLQNIITERRRELDPATVSVIEQSLKIIDAAVRQSRAALAHDPKSGFLADQLNHALDKKIELLRTVALLPSRT
jgi:hypothetical protein